MTEDKDAGVIAVLLERLEKQRLPRALAIKEKVDAGDLLNEADMQFLHEVFRDASQIGPILDRHPDYKDLAARLINLYKEITDKALENEKRAAK